MTFQRNIQNQVQHTGMLKHSHLFYKWHKSLVLHAVTIWLSLNNNNNKSQLVIPLYPGIASENGFMKPNQQDTTTWQTQEPFQQLNPSDQVIVFIFVKPAMILKPQVCKDAPGFASEDVFWGDPKNDGIHDASQYLERWQIIPKWIASCKYLLRRSWYIIIFWDVHGT